MRRRKNKLFLFLVPIVLVILLTGSILSFSFAWFTDKAESSSTITFGSILLDVTGDSAGEDGKLEFSVTRNEKKITTISKVMPGDVVNIDLTIGLEETSQPAYYLLKLTDKTEKVFTNTYYFCDGTKDSSNNLIVYQTDGTTSWVQGDTTKTAVDKKIGAISNSDTTKTHAINIQAKIPESYDTKNTSTEIKCDVFAIQQANLLPEEALTYVLAGFNEL